jgi:signal transduction histidine kinase
MLMANVLRKLIHESSLLAPDFPSFKRQESAFVVLNLFVLSVLLLIHTLFSSYFGTPPRSLIVVLAIGFFLNVVELIWLQSATFLSAMGIVILTWVAIIVNMGIAFALASLSYRQDTQYFALLVAPILQATFRFSFGSMLAVVIAGTTLDFFWVWNYFRSHPPSQISEYMEAGTISLIYATTGTLVWILVNYLRSKESDLERARQQLSTEEKLAAVGRFSSAIAHEIRNPVAMISSALATARNGGLSSEEREEMFEIAANEASRLEKLTTDFLAYARPRPPAKQLGDIAESIAYIADVCRPHACARSVTIRTDAPEGLCAKIDSGQIQQALINLVMNAIEASPAGAVVALCGKRDDGVIRVDVANPNGPIPDEAAEHVFEPFFTTKPAGTGLGLAIARNIVRGHSGELSLSRNEAGLVQFSLMIPAHTDG